ncbi:MAG: dTMP kinase [Vicinamibacterales bacterium]
MKAGQSRGVLVAFEGLDQSGKQTQAEALVRHVTDAGQPCRLPSFPDYTTHIGAEIGRGLHGERDYGPDVMQLLYVANRHEKKPEIVRALEDGEAIVCDRYIASSIAYGEAHGLDAAWLEEIQRFLPPPDLCLLLDIAPETAAARKQTGRDRYESDLALLSRVRQSYHRQAAASDRWVLLDADRAREAVQADVVTALASRLARR